jgi:hypothetical protein
MMVGVSSACSLLHIPPFCRDRLHDMLKIASRCILLCLSELRQSCYSDQITTRIHLVLPLASRPIQRDRLHRPRAGWSISWQFPTHPLALSVYLEIDSQIENTLDSPNFLPYLHTKRSWNRTTPPWYTGRLQCCTSHARIGFGQLMSPQGTCC